MNLKSLMALAAIVLALSACGSATPAASPTATQAMAKATATALPAATAVKTATATSAQTNAPPGGAPPAGNPPPGAGTGAQSATQGLSTATGKYALDGKTATENGLNVTTAITDQSGIYVTNGGSLTVANAAVNTSGNTSSDENSSFYGLNAGALAAGGSKIVMNDSVITTTGTGANGAFATGAGSSVALKNVTISATGDGGHGIMATQGGAVTLENVVMNTTGAHSAPIATDRGSGTVVSTGGSVTSSGADSPCYYSTGDITVNGNTCKTTSSEIAVIEGANAITLKDVTAQTSATTEKWGVMIYQSFSGDALGSHGIFTATGGALTNTAAKGAMFYVTNSHGTITLNGVKVSAASGVLLQAAANDRWGTSGSNGGTAELVGIGQTLNGNLVADKISAISLSLQKNSAFTGAINAENTAKTASLTLDATSSWNVGADSYLTCLANADGISGTTVSNITGNGHTVYYNASACAALGGKTYTLNGGGTLKPLS